MPKNESTAFALEPGVVPGFVAVAIASAAVDVDMVPGKRYVIVSTTNAWIKFGSAAPTAAAGSGNHYIVANVPYVVQSNGVHLKMAAIRDTADGKMTVSALAD